MSDDRTGDTRQSESPTPQAGGAVASPPPPPPAPPTTGERPPEWRDRGRRRGGWVAGLLLIAIGLILLAQQYFPAFGIDRLWPVIIIVIGLAIIFRRR
jgi:hypothetical protein